MLLLRGHKKKSAITERHFLFGNFEILFQPKLAPTRNGSEQQTNTTTLQYQKQKIKITTKISN